MSFAAKNHQIGVLKYLFTFEMGTVYSPNAIPLRYPCIRHENVNNGITQTPQTALNVWSTLTLPDRIFFRDTCYLGYKYKPGEFLWGPDSGRPAKFMDTLQELHWRKDIPHPQFPPSPPPFFSRNIHYCSLHRYNADSRVLHLFCNTLDKSKRNQIWRLLLQISFDIKRS